MLALPHFSDFYNLQSCSQLVHLELRDGIGEELFGDFVDNLSHCTALRGLEIGCHESDSKIYAEDLELMLRLAARTQLTYIGLSGARLLEVDEEEAYTEGYHCVLASVLAECQALTHLDLSCVTCGRCPEQLIGAVGNCNRLTSLALDFNPLGDNSTDLLLATLPHCGPLERLGLCSTKMGDTFAARLYELLQACPALKDLDLEENLISKQGVNSLVHAWKKLRKPLKLRKLNLKGNVGVETAAGTALRLQTMLTEVGCQLVL